MPIDFHDADNRFTYASREVHTSWLDAIAQIINPQGKTVYDIACGGGVYTRAWQKLGAAKVVGVDFSDPNLSVARAQTFDPDISYFRADALATDLPDASADIVFARALIHHTKDLPALFTEAKRLLKPDGTYLIQGRTHANIRELASANHLRGYLFELFPRLLATEDARRHTDAEVKEQLLAADFASADSHTIWETRKEYRGFAELAQELRTRTGASILFELSDGELEHLINHLEPIIGEGAFTVQDPWTLWQARK